MKVIFANGQELVCETVHSMPQHYNGTMREKLIFVFPEETSLDDIVANLTSDNCRKIWLEDDDGEKFLHENYTIRLGLGMKERGTLLQVAEDRDHRIVPYAEMVRTTYSEQQLEQLSDVVDVMLINQLEGGN